MNTRPQIRLALVLLAASLAACESSLDINLATVNAPEDVESVKVRIEAIELQDEGGGTLTIDTDDSEIDLMDFQGADLLSLVSGEEVSAGNYRSLRLIFDDRDGEVVRDGDEFPLRLLDTQPSAALELSLDDEEEESVLAVMDLRFSLSEQTSTGTFRLRQATTAVRGDDAGSLVGTVDEDFVAAGNCAGIEEGYAMYLYEGSRTTLSDYFADSPTQSPLVSATLTRAGDDGDYGYRFRGLPPGSYTVGFTCEADLDDPFTQQATLKFRGAEAVTIEAGREETQDF